MGAPTLADLKLLAAFADGGTVRSAARALGLDKPTLSRRLSELEHRLGEALFLRRGRALTTTRVGALVIARAREVTAGMEDLGALLDVGGDRPVVISASPLFAELLLPDVLVAVRRRHPGVRLVVQVSHEYRELFDDRIDVALRRGPLESSDSLKARRLGTSTMVVIAHPSLAPPSRPLEQGLAAQPWVRVGAMLEPLRVSLGARRTTTLVVPSMAVDSQRAAVELVRRRLGVARVNHFFVKQALANGELVEWLPEARTKEGVFAVWPRSRRPTPAARTLVEVLAAQAAHGELIERF